MIRASGTTEGRRTVDVSVVIPFRNVRDFLAETVESVIAQTLGTWELVLVDDGSTDGTREVAEAYAAEDPQRIACIAHANGVNLGISASRNAGWSRTVGRYVVCMDGDDLLVPAALETLAEALDRHPSAAAAQGRCVYWHSWRPGATERDVVHVYPFDVERVISPPSLLAGPLIGSFAWPGTCATMYRRSRCPEAGPYDPRFRTLYEDLVAYTRIVLTEDVYVSDRVVALYRQRPSSVTGSISRRDEGEHRLSVLQWIESHLAAQPVRDPRPRRWLRLARLLHAHPRLARARRTMQRVTRVARGYPPDLEEAPPPASFPPTRPSLATHGGSSPS